VYRYFYHLGAYQRYCYLVAGTLSAVLLRLRVRVGPAPVLRHRLPPPPVEHLQLVVGPLSHRVAVRGRRRLGRLAAVAERGDAPVEHVLAVDDADVAPAVALRAVPELEVEAPGVDEVVLDHVPRAPPRRAREHRHHHLHPPRARRPRAVAVAPVVPVRLVEPPAMIIQVLIAVCSEPA
jgi:hypothetical protein